MRARWLSVRAPGSYVWHPGLLQTSSNRVRVESFIENILLLLYINWAQSVLSNTFMLMLTWLWTVINKSNYIRPQMAWCSLSGLRAIQVVSLVHATPSFAVPYTASIWISTWAIKLWLLLLCVLWCFLRGRFGRRILSRWCWLRSFSFFDTTLLDTTEYAC